MADRPERVRVATRYGECELRWESRERLITAVRESGSERARDVVAVFETAGASRPVELDRDGKALVVEAIHDLSRTAHGAEKLSTDLRELLRALVDELDRDLIG